ncbi:tetratricopeptide repeat protein [Cerasicoccus fimbriatus]|uniref:tetratricopeptide repeat protein n=1 Tax=Cerasicoccus fimbriatus TaxID=3014554 RepID=UPI0022B3447A|nr:tetratricopeptide repeat protein [Cerasicoccus sp. TK19100]
MASKGKAPLPWVGLALVLTVAIGTAIFLIPSKSETFSNLIKDREFDKAREQIDQMAMNATTPEARAEVERARIEVAIAEARSEGEQIDAPTTEAIIRQVLSASAHDATTADYLEALALTQEIPAPAKFTPLEPFALAPALRDALRKTLTQQAGFRGQPAVAAQWHEALLTSPASAEDLKTGVALWRSTGDPARAFEFWQKYSAGSNDFSPVHLALLLELNRAPEAFALAQNYLTENPEKLGKEISIDEYISLATMSDQFAQAVPLIVTYSEAHPEDSLAHEKLIEYYIGNGRLNEALRLLEYELSQTNSSATQAKLAQVREWAGDPGKAFDLYLRMAADGDPHAVNRLLELNPGLYRSREVIKALKAYNPEKLTPDQQSALFDLEVQVGAYREAITISDLLLAESPDRPELWKKRGDLMRADHRLTEAVASYTKALEYAPDSIAIRRELARTLLFARDYTRAKEEYAKVYAQSGAAPDLQKLLELNRMTGDWNAYYSVLNEQFTNNHLTEPALYSDLANHYIAQKKSQVAESVLRNGIERFPDNDNLKIALLYHLSNLEKNAEALALIERYPALQNDQQLRSVRLYLLTRVNRNEDALALLETLPKDEWQNSADMLEMAAMLYQETSDSKTAEALYERAYQLFPDKPENVLRWASILAARGDYQAFRALVDPLLENPTPEVLRLTAQTLADVGQYQEAEKMMIRYVRLVPVPTPADWGMLGDIRLSRGDNRGAKQAYRLAANELIRSSKG